MNEDPFASLDIRLVQAAPFVPDKSGGVKAAVVHLPDTFPEVDLFSLLLWRFGRPNGMLTIFGPPHGDSAGPFKWDFSFATPDGLTVAIIRNWRQLEVMTKGRSLAKSDVLGFLDFNLSLYREAVAARRQELERYRLIINPYVRHKRMAEFAESQLLQTVVPDIWYPENTIVAQHEMDRHLTEVTAHQATAAQEVFFAVTLVSESAFMAEAFLNLLLAISLKDVIRDNATLFDEALRRSWKLKLQHLPLTSRLVPTVPNMGDTRVRDADKLFRLRNRIVHSYPDKDDLCVGEMFFFENFPALETGKPFDAVSGIDSQRLLPTRAEALRAKTYADGLVSFISEQIASPGRADFLLCARSSPIGYNETTRRFAYIFPSTDVRMFLRAPEDPPQVG